MNILFRIRFEGDNYRTNGGRHVKFVKTKERKHIYTLCMTIYLQVNHYKHENHNVLAGKQNSHLNIT